MAGTLVANTINTDTGLFSTNNAYNYIPKAWVNFGYVSSAITIRASYNVTSVTRNTTGSYTINLTTAMPSANYAILGTLSTGNSGVSAINHTIQVDTSAAYGTVPTTSAFTVQTGLNYFTSSAVSDEPYVYVAVISN